MFFEQMHPNWQDYLADQRSLLEKIEGLVANESELVPSKELVMRAFELDPDQMRVVILGQDPYPNPEHAIGLSFAVPKGTTAPGSLRNILSELGQDLGIALSPEPDLAEWAKRGVLLLNSSLTAKAHKPGSHANLGWQDFTETALQVLAGRQRLVILAWGNHAKSIGSKLQQVSVIESAHPSPLSAHRGFMQSKPFSRANQALVELGLEPIDWSL